MKDIILVSHGHLASGMASSVELITGKQENLHALDMYMDNQKLDEKLENLIKNKDIHLDQTIIITDILGGSVNQEILSRVDLSQTIIITGMNLPLLLALITSDLNSINLENVHKIIEQANDQIILVNSLVEDTEDDF